MENNTIIIQKKYRRLIVIKCFMVACLFLQTIIVKSQVETLTVISNLNGAPGAMKLSELKSIFMGEKQRWKTGIKITLALMKTNTAVGKNTSLKLYDMSGDELNKFWLALVFQGKVEPPHFFNNTSELENFVAQNPGAIGVIDKPFLTNNEIKIVAIDGKIQLNL